MFKRLRVPFLYFLVTSHPVSGTAIPALAISKFLHLTVLFAHIKYLATWPQRSRVCEPNQRAGNTHTHTHTHTHTKLYNQMVRR